MASLAFVRHDVVALESDTSRLFFSGLGFHARILQAALGIVKKFLDLSS